MQWMGALTCGSAPRPTSGRLEAHNLRLQQNTAAINMTASRLRHASASTLLALGAIALAAAMIVGAALLGTRSH